jgi:hypothetical protein
MYRPKLTPNNNRTLIKLLLIIWGLLLLIGCLRNDHLKNKNILDMYYTDTIQKKTNKVYIYRKN